MRAQRGRADSRLRGEPEHRAAVTRCVGVVSESSEVAKGRACLHGRQRADVERDSPVGRERLLDRQPRELVSKTDDVTCVREHTRAQTLGRS